MGGLQLLITIEIHGMHLVPHISVATVGCTETTISMVIIEMTQGMNYECRHCLDDGVYQDQNAQALKPNSSPTINEKNVQSFVLVFGTKCKPELTRHITLCIIVADITKRSVIY